MLQRLATVDAFVPSLVPAPRSGPSLFSFRNATRSFAVAAASICFVRIAFALKCRCYLTFALWRLPFHSLFANRRVIIRQCLTTCRTAVHIWQSMNGALLRYPHLRICSRHRADWSDVPRCGTLKFLFLTNLESVPFAAGANVTLSGLGFMFTFVPCTREVFRSVILAMSLAATGILFAADCSDMG